MLLFEDAAHVLLPGEGMGEAELVIFSPRKLLAIPSGGLLLIREDWASHLVAARGNPSIRENVQWVVRRGAQRIMVGLHVPWHVFQRRSGNSGGPSTVPGPSDEMQACDPFSLRCLAIAEGDLPKVAGRRRQNYARLAEWTAAPSGGRPFFQHLPEGVCPYVFPLRVPGGCERLVLALQSRGIPASRWPDLPPEVLAAKDEHAVAVSMYEQVFLLPIHQSLSLKEIDAVGRHLRFLLETA
jgi:hypothetical protein